MLDSRVEELAQSQEDTLLEIPVSLSGPGKSNDNNGFGGTVDIMDQPRQTRKNKEVIKLSHLYKPKS